MEVRAKLGKKKRREIHFLRSLLRQWKRPSEDPRRRKKMKFPNPSRLLSAWRRDLSSERKSSSLRSLPWEREIAFREISSSVRVLAEGLWISISSLSKNSFSCEKSKKAGFWDFSLFFLLVAVGLWTVVETWRGCGFWDFIKQPLYSQTTSKRIMFLVCFTKTPACNIWLIFMDKW